MLKKILFSLLIILLFLSCAQPQDNLSQAVLSVPLSKSFLTYRFTAVRGDEDVFPSSCTQEMNSLSSFLAGSYPPGLWTFAVCGFDSDENAVEFGKTTVYLSPGETGSISVNALPLSPSYGSGSVTFNVSTAAVEGTHSVLFVLSKDSEETDVILTCSSDGSRAQASKTVTLESGIYTVEEHFFVKDICYYTDVRILRILSDKTVRYETQAEITPAFISIDFTDMRLDYGLNENPDKICTGFRNRETGEIINLDEMYLSPVGQFWNSVSDLNLEPVLSDPAAETLSSVYYAAIGPGVTLSAGLFSNTSGGHNTTLKALVCYASAVPNYCFAYCDNLETACMRTGVTQLNRCVFCNCVSLEKVTFASSVSIMRTNCFQGCNKENLYVYVPFDKSSRPSSWTSTWALELKAGNIIYNYSERST